MTDASFDPGGFFEFDLSKGAVSARGGGRVLVLSDSVVAPLVSAAVEGGDLTAVRKLGRQLGEAAAAQLPGAARDQSAEQVLGHATAVLSLFGWGRLRVDRWGDALVATLDQLPRLDDEHLGIAALLGGLFSSLADEEVACVPVGDDGHFLLVDPAVAQQVWKWSRGGDDVAAVVGRLAPEGA
jgi:hypothetical protein